MKMVNASRVTKYFKPIPEAPILGLFRSGVVFLFANGAFKCEKSTSESFTALSMTRKVK